MKDDRLISLNAAIDAVHHTVFEFFDICEDDDESPITEKDKMLLSLNKAISTRIQTIPSAQPSATDINVAITDTISRVDAIALAEEVENKRLKGEIDLTYAPMINGIRALPSAQPNLSEAYSKAVFTWLMDYQIRAAELKGRYTPYEVLSWVINDWRKENG